MVAALGFLLSSRGPTMSQDYQLLPPMQPQDSGQTRRTLLTFALCAGLVLLWMKVMPTSVQPPAPVVPAVQAAPAATAPAAPAKPEVPVEVTLTTDLLQGRDLKVVVTNQGAGFLELTCLENREAAVNYESPVYVERHRVPPLMACSCDGLLSDRRWNRISRDASSARFETMLSSGVVLTKTLKVPASGYLLEVALEARNPGSQPATLALEALVPAPEEHAASGSRVVSGPVALLDRTQGGWTLKSQAGAAVIKKGPWKPEDPGPLRWGGITSGYFVALATQDGTPFLGMEARPVWANPAAVQDDKLRDPAKDAVISAMALGSWTLEPGAVRTAVLHCYVGPKKAGVLAAAGPALPQVLDRGMIATPLMAILEFFQHLSGNYGVAIILMTLLVRVAIHPLNRMAQISMLTTSEKMKRLQPRLDELKKRHKGNSRKLMEEQTQVMKEEGMTPFSPVMGCLPMLLQMPVLFALYGVLQGAIELRGAPFCLWVHDLAKPDTVAQGLPLLGALNPLPIVLILVTLVQMWRAPKPSDPQMAQQQKIMMFIMPAMFGFMFYGLPSGITLYWLTSTTFSIGEQAWIKRLLRQRGVLPAPAPAA